MKKQKAIKTQPKQNFSKILKQNHIDGSSSEDDKPLIFLTKYIQEETDVVKDLTYRTNISDAYSSDSEFSENQSEWERASTKEKKYAEKLLDKSLKKLKQASSQTNRETNNLKRSQ